MRDYSIEANGISYSCIEAGSGPLLLLAHGTFGGKQLMLPQLEYLSRTHRCVAFDWRGHGASSYDPAGWTADDLVEDVAALVPALGETSAVMAGVSQGGAIGMRVAIKYPHLLRALVNMCGGPSGPPPVAGERLDAYAAIFAAEADEGRRRAAAVEFASGYFHAPGFIEREPERFAAEVDVILAHSRESVRLLPGVPKSYVDITPRLGQIACPTLIIWAPHDARPHLGAELAAAIPDGRLMTIPDAGHHVNVDAPADTSCAIAAFLDTLGETGSGGAGHLP
jgi:pimeloyl-ACP methyl ester carboxylesterase